MMVTDDDEIGAEGCQGLDIGNNLSGMAPDGQTAAAIAARFAPHMRERDCPAGMYARIQALTHFAAEEPANEAEGSRAAADAVAVGEYKAASEDVALDERSVDDLDAELVAQVVEEPNVVVACHPGDLHTGVGEAGQGTEEAHIAPGDDGAVLVPVIEDVAEQIEMRGIGGNAVEKAHDTQFVRTAVGDVVRAQMQIADEVNHIRGDGSEETEFELGFLTHHVLVPLGLEDEIDVDGCDSGDAAELLMNVLDDEVGHRAVRRSECHVDVECAVVLKVDFVDHAERVNVDCDLRIDDRAQILDDLFFNFKLFVLCHNIGKVTK